MRLTLTDAAGNTADGDEDDFAALVAALPTSTREIPRVAGTAGAATHCNLSATRPA